MLQKVKKAAGLCCAVLLVVIATVSGTLAYENIKNATADDLAAREDNHINVQLLRQETGADGTYVDMTENPLLHPLDTGYTENVIRIKNGGNIDTYNRVLIAVPAELDEVLELVGGDDWDLTETLNHQICEDVDCNIYVYTMKGDLKAEAVSSPVILGVRLKIGGTVDGEKYILDGKAYDFSGGVRLQVRAQTVQAAFLVSAENAFAKVGVATNPWAPPLPNQPLDKVELQAVLTTLPTGKQIKDSVSGVVFGRKADYENVRSSCYGQAVDANNPNGPWVYYQPATDAAGATTWKVYVLSDEVVYLPENCEALFMDMTALTSVDTSFLDTSHVTNMHAMFQNCTKLASVDVSKWDMSKVKQMSQMFYQCAAIDNLDVSKWNTSSLTSMTQMFNGCSSLTYLDTKNWDVSKVTGSYSYMFSNCKKLTAVDVAGWVTKDTKSISFMFLNCNQLESIDVSGWDTSNVTAMDNAFNGCSSVKELDVSNWNTAKVTTTWQMFQNCSKVTTLNLTGWDTSNVTSMANMFNGCRSLTVLDLSSFDVKKVTKATTMFNNCSNLTTIYASADAGWDAVATSHADEVMFASCKKLVGGAGTTFQSQYGIYARIDGGTTAPGYFTEKSGDNAGS